MRYCFLALMAFLSPAFLAAQSGEKPAFPTGTRILFQGDSIVDGDRGSTADPTSSATAMRP